VGETFDVWGNINGWNTSDFFKIMVKTFLFFRMKLGEIGVLSERMKTGLDKLIEAEKSVSALSIELAVKEKDLAVASQEADEVRRVHVF